MNSEDRVLYFNSLGATVIQLHYLHVSWTFKLKKNLKDKIAFPHTTVWAWLLDFRSCLKILPDSYISGSQHTTVGMFFHKKKELPIKNHCQIHTIIFLLFVRAAASRGARVPSPRPCLFLKPRYLSRCLRGKSHSGDGNRLDIEYVRSPFCTAPRIISRNGELYSALLCSIVEWSGEKAPHFMPFEIRLSQ